MDTFPNPYSPLNSLRHFSKPIFHLNAIQQQTKSPHQQSTSNRTPRSCKSQETVKQTPKKKARTSETGRCISTATALYNAYTRVCPCVRCFSGRRGALRSWLGIRILGDRARWRVHGRASPLGPHRPPPPLLTCAHGLPKERLLYTMGLVDAVCYGDFEGESGILSLSTPFSTRV